ncbi:Hypothetical predicted protein [Mytilus galloprovincialis]|uniref:VWFA domain-containing protein n=1 Tax=Mytilus galloprovincialis TaxID=29158 RepID=A0A8B6H0N7_MYTGA|nr:Hypothetical predicted protein [Mytilus galloprovincialis]
MKIPIFIVLLCLIVRNTHQQGLNCYVPADILILLDGSDSIQDRDWTNAKTFVKQLIKQFDVAPDAIHMGIVVYSSNIGDYVSFAPFKPKTMLEIISTSLRQPKHSTNTAKGIQYAREQFKKDGRQGVPKILIVITDGSSDSPRDTHSQAELAKIEGIRILALGVGKQIFKDELRQIASSPRKVYTATSYITLQGLISEIRNMVCQGYIVKRLIWAIHFKWKRWKYFHGIPWKKKFYVIYFHGIPWKNMEIFPWNSMENVSDGNVIISFFSLFIFHGFPWKTGSNTPWNFHGNIPWNSMKFSMIDDGKSRDGYRIEELPIDGLYFLTVTLSVCLEANADCAVQRLVANNLKLFKPTCITNDQFAIPGFSLLEWKDSKGLSSSNSLPEYAAFLLMSDLKIAKYKKEPKCTIASPGWQSGGCPLNVDKPMLHDNVTCQVTSSCTGVTCCVYTEELNRNLDVHLLLNPCDQSLSLTIDYLKYNRSLFDFSFGSLQKFYMENVVRIDYVIYDLTNNFQYLVDMNISVCYESSGPCELESMIFHDSVLHKKPCQWRTGFRDPNFSESDWRNEMNITSDAQLFPVDIARLTEALYVGPYQADTPCQGYNSPYTGSINGWKDECSASDLENLPSAMMKCYIPANCSFIRCCHEVGLLGTPMETELEIDSCNFELSVRIEKLKFKIPFHDYQWGVVQSMDLFGLLTMDFVIENLYEAQQFLISMNLTLSYESAGPIKEANILMDKALLSKRQCEWSSDFHIYDFSLYTYLINRNQKPTGPLTPSMLLQFMEDTNLAPFMQDEMCNRTGALYNNQSWTQDCAANLTLPTLSDKVNGHITTMCTGVQGCIENDLIQRSLEFSLLLDPCSNRLSISIERARYNRTLSDFEYGDDHYYNLQGIIRLKYFRVVVTMDVDVACTKNM